jgi:hypothetical protein
MSDIPNDDLLPCGCVLRYSMAGDIKTMTVIPCQMNCRNLIATLEMGMEKGIAPEFRSGG